MKNYKLLMEAVPFGQFYKPPAAWEYNLIANLFFFHLSFIIYHLLFIIKKRTAPLVAGGKGNE